MISAPPGSTAGVSIAMATHNGLPFVRRQLASILDQIEMSDQLVIVDDASSDGTWEYLQGVDHPAIELFRQPLNLGVRRTFEAALTVCRHDIVFLCDQDDIWRRDKRSAVVQAFAERPATTIVISDARVVNANDRVIAGSFMATRGGFKGDLTSTVLKNRYLGCAMSLRRSLLALALPIPPGAPMHDMWLGAMGTIAGHVLFIDETLIDYRRHDRNASSFTHASILQMMRWRFGFVAAIVSRIVGHRFRQNATPDR